MKQIYIMVAIGLLAATGALAQPQYNINQIITNAFAPSNFISVTLSPVIDVDGNGDLQGVGTNAYRSFVPAESGVADLGRTNAQWRNGYFAEVLVDNVSIPPIPRVATSQQEALILQYDPVSTQYFWGGVGYPVPSFDGTNVFTYTTTYSTNLPIEPARTHTVSPGVTQIVVHAWGAAGGGAQAVGGAGGYVFAILSTIPGTVYEVIVGNGGVRGVTANSIAAGGSPNGGDGYYGGAVGISSAASGGGYSGLLINDSTNYVVVAGAGSGGGDTATGRNGGGRIGQDGATLGSNTVAGIGARADNFYGLNAVAGTNTTGFGSGGFLQGGHAQTNAFGSGVSGRLGGGGAGWFGGSAGGVTAATSGGASGGGGISYANPAYVTFAYSVRSPTIGTAPVTDLPIYVAGRANSPGASLNGQPGLVVIIE